MKKGWEYKTLKEISIIYGNYGLSVSSIPYNGVRYLRITDITENGELNDDKVSADISSGKTQEELQEGDILFARTGATVGKTLIYRKEFGKCLFAGYLIRYRLNKDIVIPQFIHHFTHSSGYYKWVSSNQKAAAQPNIGAKIYNELRIPLPPLSEQKEIVEYLDSSFAKIDTLKANAAKNLDEAKALFQSALKDALESKEGCSYDKLVNVYNFIDYRGATPTKISEGVPLVTAKNVKYGYLDYTIKDFISEDEYAQRQSRGISHKGDLLFTTEAPLGNVAIADLDRFSAGQRLITFQKYSKSKYEVENKFYFFYMLSPVFQAKIKSLATGATAQGIKAKILKEIIVPIPSLPEQQSIVSFLDSLNEKVNTLQQNYSRICDECDALKQAILRQVFE